MLELKLGKQHRELDLAGVAAITFPPADTAQVPSLDDSLDHFQMRDGRVLRGVFHCMDAKKVYAQIAGTHEPQAFSFDLLQAVVFAPGILGVDRREFGKGFNLFGESTELELASFYAQEIETGAQLIDDPTITAYVSELGQRVAAGSKRPDLPYTFKIINSRTVNAFTVGGGRVYIYRGLLEQMGSECELAGVLAHEIGHNVGKHTARQLSKQLLLHGVVAASGKLAAERGASWSDALKRVGGVLAYFQTLKYSRDDEREADYLGVYNLYHLGLDPHGMVSLFETLKHNETHEPSRFEIFFQTHPSLTERIANTGSEIQRLRMDGLRQDSPSFQEMKVQLLTLPPPIERRALIAETVVVPAHNRREWTITIDAAAMKSCQLKGAFLASGGSGNDIRVLLLDEIAVQNYANGHAFRALYDSGRLTAGELSISVPQSGAYHLVLDNIFSLVSAKTVILTLRAEYIE